MISDSVLSLISYPFFPNSDFEKDVRCLRINVFLCIYQYAVVYLLSPVNPRELYNLPFDTSFELYDIIMSGLKFFIKYFNSLEAPPITCVLSVVQNLLRFHSFTILDYP